jgi:TPR repeat protein
MAALVFSSAGLLTVGCGRNQPADPAPVVEQPGLAVGSSEKNSTAPATAGPHVFNRAVVLSIGIDNYPRLRRAGDLKCAEADAKAVADLFEKDYGYQAVPLYGPSASKRAIESALERLGGELGKNDVLVIYFAGHGQVIPVKDGKEEGYLIPADADLDFGDFHDPELWKRQAIDMTALTDRVIAMGALHVLLVADACCSGYMTTRGSLARSDRSTFLYKKSRAVFTATGRHESARENHEAGHGFFTSAFLKQLKRQNAASVVELHDPILQQVSSETNGRMTPRFCPIGDGEGMFVFVPKAIPDSQITADLKGQVPGTDLPGYLSQVITRERERTSRFTLEAEAYEACFTPSFGQSPYAEQLRAKWKPRFDRFTKNVAANDFWAMVALYGCYAKGLGTDKNPALAYQWAQQLVTHRASAGAGEFFLGECYRLGIGVAKQELTAKALYAQSAAQGFVGSQTVQADLTLSRTSATPDEIKAAVKALERAVEKKFPPAYTLLASVYLSGRPTAGIPVDLPKAFKLYEDAADMGDAPAMLQVYYGRCEDRPGMPKDLEKAGLYLRRAAEAGYVEGQLKWGREFTSIARGRMLNYPVDEKVAYQWISLAAEAGNGQAEYVLTLMYLFGKGVEQNEGLAKEWCEKSAAQNYADAVMQRGRWYATGRVYAKSDANAAAQYARGVDLKHPHAAIAYVSCFCNEDFRFKTNDGNWFAILRYSALAALPPSDDVAKGAKMARGAYFDLIFTAGTTGKQRWSAFENAYPDLARTLKDASGR